MKTLFNQDEIPLPALEKLGLVRDGKIALEEEDLTALLSGRRTDLVPLKNLRSDELNIAELDARLSLQKNDEGKAVLKIHPIYKEARKHPLLSDAETEKLVSGKFSHLQKEIIEEGAKKKRIVEYDAATREFIDYDPEQVVSPDKVNGQALSDKQKERFRHGDLITLADGTRLQHRASERQGVVSDHTALVLSVMLDGGVTYLLLRSVKNLVNSLNAQKLAQSEAYQEALKEIEKKHSTGYNPQLEKSIHDFLQNRGYSRNSSR